MCVRTTIHYSIHTYDVVSVHNRFMAFEDVTYPFTFIIRPMKSTHSAPISFSGTTSFSLSGSASESAVSCLVDLKVSQYFMY